MKKVTLHKVSDSLPQKSLSWHKWRKLHKNNDNYFRNCTENDGNKSYKAMEPKKIINGFILFSRTVSSHSGFAAKNLITKLVQTGSYISELFSGVAHSWLQRGPAPRPPGAPAQWSWGIGTADQRRKRKGPGAPERYAGLSVFIPLFVGKPTLLLPRVKLLPPF